MRENRGSWYLVTGLMIGVVLGLLYAWVIAPKEISDTTPSMLRQEYQDQYRVLVAKAFLTNGDLVRARARLDKLDEQDPFQSLLEQAQRSAILGDTSEAEALRLLARALSQPVPLAPLEQTDG